MITSTFRLCGAYQW